MEQVLASLAPLIWQLFIAAHNTIANGTFGLSFHSAIDVPLESSQRID